MITVCSRFLCDESGATAIEYGLMAAGIALAVLATVNSLGSSVKTLLFDDIIDGLTS
jgi:pilus assembly protein Flp/PilA